MKKMIIALGLMSSFFMLAGCVHKAPCACTDPTHASCHHKDLKGEVSHVK